MGGAFYVKVEGDKELTRQFRKLGFKTSDLSDVFHRIAAEVAHDAYRLAPRVSGRLAADIRPTKAKTRATIMAGRKSVPYAGPINYGWPARGIRPSMFMQRAADPKAEEAAEEIAEGMRKRIRECGFPPGAL